MVHVGKLLTFRLSVLVIKMDLKLIQVILNFIRPRLHELDWTLSFRYTVIVPKFVDFADKVELFQGRHRRDSLAEEYYIIHWYRGFVPVKVIVDFLINGYVLDRPKFLLIETQEECMNLRAEFSVKEQCIERGVEDSRRLVEDVAKAERV